MKGFEMSRDRRMLLQDAGIAAALGVGSIAPIFASPDASFILWATCWSAVMCLGLILRRAAPTLALLIVAGAGVGMAVTLTVPLPALLAVPLVSYSVARYQGLNTLPFVLAFALIGSVAGPYAWTRALPLPYRLFGAALLVLLCFSLVAVAYLAGRLVRARHLTESLDQEITTQRFMAAQRQSEQETALATGRVRTEVAQELHDVLAHSLSVIVVQAEGARALTVKRPEAATEALDVIAETGRRSIGEVRRIVALLRGDGQLPQFGPAPSLAEIHELASAAGSRVTLTVTGPTPLVPESLGLAAYRVLQESITNFLKHAGPTAACEAQITYSPEEIELLVRDDGIGALAVNDGHGSGLAGMRERVLAMGGQFHAGPRPGGGYQVQARLPMPSQLGAGWLRGAS